MPNLRNLQNNTIMYLYDYIVEAIECDDLDTIEADLHIMVDNAIDEYKFDNDID